MMAAVKKGAWERERRMKYAVVVDADEGEDGGDDDDDENNFDYSSGQVHRRGKHHHGMHRGQ